MERVVLALASNERYFHGLYCAVASALIHLHSARKLDVKVLDGGLSQRCRDFLSRLIDSVGESAELEFVNADPSVFEEATLGPGQSHMTYCRTLLPKLLDVPRLIYLDCDVLVFRDLSGLFDHQLSRGKILAAVPDSETLTLDHDSRRIAAAMNLPNGGRYFNAGVVLLNLEELRKQDFTEQSLEFFKKWREHYRFWDQSAINFLLYGQIEELPEYWNRAAWQFDAQDNNQLDCVIHYTTSVPWLGATARPAQALFERFAVQVGLPVDRRSSAFQRSVRQRFWRSAIAPVRALVFPVAALCYRLLGNNDKSAAYQKVARYWLDYIRNAPRRRRLYRQRSEEINRMKFDVHASLVS
jgi:lipopolysaccharide biosynthesis glycosyltransferase